MSCDWWLGFLCLRISQVRESQTQISQIMKRQKLFIEEEEEEYEEEEEELEVSSPIGGFPLSPIPPPIPIGGFPLTLNVPTIPDGGQEYDDVKRNFELTHFFVSNESAIYHRQNNMWHVKPYKMAVTQCYQLYYYEKNKKGTQYLKKKFIERWICDDNIKKYEKTGIFPPGVIVPDNVLNIWTDFHGKYLWDTEEPYCPWFIDLDTQPTPNENDWVLQVPGETDVQFQARVIRNFSFLVWNMAGQTMDTYQFLIKWCANIFQRPHLHSTAVNIKGDEGCCKSLFGEILTSVIGEAKCVATDDPTTTFNDKYNSQLTKYFKLIEECKIGSMSKELMKRLVNGTSAVIREKYLTDVKINTYSRVLILVNYVLKELVGRRYVCLQASRDLIGLTKFYVPFWTIKDDPRAIKALYALFTVGIDLRGFDSDTQIITKFHADIIAKGGVNTPLVEFIEEKVKNTSLHKVFRCGLDCGGVVCTIPVVGDTRLCGRRVIDFQSKALHAEFANLHPDAAKLIGNMCNAIDSLSIQFLPSGASPVALVAHMGKPPNQRTNKGVNKYIIVDKVEEVIFKQGNEATPGDGDDEEEGEVGYGQLL